MKYSMRKVVSLVLAIALVIAGGFVPNATKKAEAASYQSCLVFQTSSYYCRDGLDSSNHGSVIKQKTTEISGTSCKDATIAQSKKKKTYTVSVSGINKCKFSATEIFNLLYVDTNIPISMAKKVKITNLIIKFDGKQVKKISKPYITPEEGSSTVQAVAINSYNDDVKWSVASKKMPKKNISITYTIQFK
ncbi:MAG: hypothetical protein K6G11_01180 [Lachnospiraceae bacterium]|nr:hypothetical protein [Lachnospiraceae bacterium]